MVSFPKISSSGKFSVSSESFAKFVFSLMFHCYHKVNVEDKIMVDYVCSECLID